MKNKTKSKVYRIISAFLAINILFETITPTCAFALTGGPSQPEVESFTPVGTSDMVDPFTGNFSYNIPLLDVDGYPINIGYNAGVTMDQEASWVGLGWNINPGVINRSMRGLPDDFNGDMITKELKMKPNETYGFNIGANIELFGLDKDKLKMLKLGLGYGLGVKYNNYNGYAANQSLNLSFSAGDDYKSPLSVGLGINSTSDEGITLSPSISLSGRISKSAQSEQSLSFGASLNSRAGLKELTIGSTTTRANTKGRGVSANNASTTFNFGMRTYIPSGGLPMQNFSITGNFKLGFALWGLHPNVTVGGFYSGQKLETNIISNPAYGYMNADEGTKYDNSLMDFNREKDGPFTASTPALALANNTYDIYSVFGQGISGSYRPFRSDLGHVYDPKTTSTSDGHSIGAEVGFPMVFHAGVDYTINNTHSTTGRWKGSYSNSNLAASRLTYQSNTNDPLYEKYYFKEAGEKSVDADPSFYEKAYGVKPAMVYLDQTSKFNTAADNFYAKYSWDGSDYKFERDTEISKENYRKTRERRNQSITTLAQGELGAFATENLQSSLNPIGTAIENAKAHHIGEISSLTNDGTRYVYGIAAYNKKQEEVTFAVGNDSKNNPGRTPNLATGLVKYAMGDNTVANSLGKDNYFSNTKTPAFAHSYLLTSILSADYVDSDNARGPSKGDIGSYTKFNYSEKEKVSDYNWRVPVGERQANYEEGLRTDKTDNKASYIFGTKDLYYLTAIETKNYIAVFSLSAREDGYGVENKDGKRANIKPMKKLDKITLYAKEDHARYLRDLQNGVTPLVPAVEIKTVNFEYDYSLCGNVPNNSGKTINVDNTNINAAKGKLTLKKIYFTYQNSKKARLSPYQFIYADANHDGQMDTRVVDGKTIYPLNPNYDIKAYDRWGNYMPASKILSAPGAANPFIQYSYEYPYVEQNKTTADEYAQAWNLSEIIIPSGGRIKVDYEADDYAFVQNKQANQMFKVIATEPVKLEATGFLTLPATMTSGAVNPVTYATGTRLIIKLQNPITGPGTTTALQKQIKFKELYFDGLDHVYFRFLMRITKPYLGDLNCLNRDEYVSGYLPITNVDFTKSYVNSTGEYACIAINNVPVNGTGSTPCCPITKAAIQFGRLNMSNEVWNVTAPNESNDFEKMLNAIANSDIFKNINDLVQGSNQALYYKNRGLDAKMDLSWIRLKSPNKKKLGGGYRVKKIAISDQWNGTGISTSPNTGFNYGQEFSYVNDDNTSSGVACYEPQLGGDENSLKVPVFFNDNKLLAPDDEHYMEEPFGESFFPSPGVGYSKVTIKNLQHVNVTHNATGKTVKEFYTAKDFPTITERTPLKAKPEKDQPFSLSSLFKLEVKDYMTASQGYLIETNDMHGKLWKESVYQEGQKAPISSIEYHYKKTNYGNGSYRLDNKASVINSNGSVDNNATIGMTIDYVADSREAVNSTTAPTFQANTDGLLFLVAVVPIPVGLPSVATERTQFRSMVITKIIQRFGILEKTIATNLGSTVSTSNLGYDAETGEVVLTETQTDFNDKLYSLTYPAYWYYDGMGPAYKNVGFAQSNIVFDASGTATLPNALVYFAEGDEIAIKKIVSNGFFPIVEDRKAWVVEVGANTVKIIDRNGDPIAGFFNRILRSGRRNQQGVPMASISTMNNPINNIQANIYQNVLSAQANEFTNSWRTFCDCFQDGSTVDTYNPYILGTKGMYKINKTYANVTGRTQSDYNGNTNIRKDGVYTSYAPFYKFNGSKSKWEIDAQNWTFASEITEFSPFGMDLENRDALNLYSSAIYSYNQTLPIAVAANARYKNIGYDNFEDYDLKTCADNHFKFMVSIGNVVTLPDTTISIRSSKSKTLPTSKPNITKSYIVSDRSHTGKYSLKVEYNEPIKMVKQIKDCNYMPCNLTVTLSKRLSTATHWCFDIGGGWGPYQYDWSSSGVEAKVHIGNSSDKIYVAKSAIAYDLFLTVSDQKTNCKNTFTIKINDGTINSVSEVIDY